MSYPNANEFAARTFFLSENDEEMLEQGKTLTVECGVNALGTDGVDEWVAASVMFASDLEEIRSFVEMGENDEPVINTDKLQDSDVPSAIGRNNRQMDIINISPDEFAKLAPGETIKARVRLNRDDEGNRYLNLRGVEMVEHEAEGESVDELASEPQHASAQ